MQIYDMMLYFFVYGFLGWCTEVAYATTRQKRFVNRGFLNGPICPIYGVGVVVVVSFLTPFKENLLMLYVTSTILVTVLEGVTGFLMDKIFHHKWWDYSNRPLNIGGYVCLLFSIAWGVGCVIIVKLIHPLIAKGLSFLPHMAVIVLLIVLEIILAIDLFITAAEILKFNHRMEAMAKIAAELRELSDKVGENIYENVLGTMEATEEGKRKLDEMTEESRRKLGEVTEESRRKLGEVTEESRRKLGEMTEESRRKLGEMTEESKRKLDEVTESGRRKSEELRKKYEELAGQSSVVANRLMDAFPKMQPRATYKNIFNELKAKMKRK